ncbi:MFS transporter [Pseudomonas sp. CFBP13509]|uniref:DHA2 family efflux MFS transporter permease subunit n=1 Tax=Pseudomonas sp. CFBP13509 TaxID=2184008 RepID=UPI0010C0AD28|nr:DHA2 family efflux MFS transporter permease subunit [Pseudomonas sp. CFBP13509]TKJ75664.1 MFS transporter [Pseudomonas sp. CFBP13509]
MSSATPDSAAQNRLSLQTSLIALVVAVTFFMENLDATVIATALPTMASAFGVTPVDMNIGITAYILAVAICIPLSSWVADRFGARRVFAGAIILFTLASLLCGLSQSIEMFVFARVLQGIGGALMVPVGRLAVLRNTDKKDLVKMIAIITWPGLVAPILGPLVGGLIVTHASWPWIFYVNLPLGALALAAALWLVPEDREASVRQFDAKGFVLLAGACVALLGGLEWLGNQTGERLIPGAVLVAAGIALAVWAVHHCRHASDPLLPLETLSIDTFRVSIYGGSLFRLAISALPFLLPLLFQVAFGLSPVDAGLLVLAVFAGNLAMKPFTTAIMRRYGFRRVLLVNGIIGVVSIAACALFTVQTPFVLIAAVLFVGGLSRSMQFTCYNSIGFADVPKPRMSEASALFSMSFQLAMGMGVTVAALLLRASMTQQGHEMQAQVGDFRVAFVGVALLGAWALVDVYRLTVGAGESVLNRQ